MKRFSRGRLVAGMLLARLVLGWTGPAIAEPAIPAEEVQKIARDAYVYAYPLVLMDVTIRQTTNYAEPTGVPGQGPFNQFSHGRAFPPADFKIIVRPNVDTLYSAASLDLQAEPLVLTVPATDRYFMLPMLSMWTDVFAVPGTRTTGRNTAREFLIVGPTGSFHAPQGLEVIRSPTRYVSILGRVQTNGVADYENVHAIQDQFRIVPLSAWGRADYVPPHGQVDPAIDMQTPPPEQVANMDAAVFFARFAELLEDNPPQPCDYPLLHRLERAGLSAGQKFDLAELTEDQRQAFERGAREGRKRVAELGRVASGIGQPGWVYTTRAGAYGVDYDYRAAVALFALGMNLSQDAIYPSLSMDSREEPLDGNRRYVLRFEQGALPPVGAFWSVTAYDQDGYFIPNDLDRQALGDRDPLKVNSDGSVEILVQTESPGGDRESNWLPVFRGPFTLMLRLYSPQDAALNGAWTPPQVTPVDE